MCNIIRYRISGVAWSGGTALPTVGPGEPSGPALGLSNGHWAARLKVFQESENLARNGCRLLRKDSTFRHRLLPTGE